MIQKKSLRNGVNFANSILIKKTTLIYDTDIKSWFRYKSIKSYTQKYILDGN